jgi:hypothetical protein
MSRRLPRIVATLCSFAIYPAIASLPLEATLLDLACGADHVLVGRVIGVDAVDKNGIEIHDEKAMTGAGKENKIRLVVSVEEVVTSTSQKIAPTLRVPLDSNMHFSLGQIKSAHQEPSEPLLVFLSGTDFQPIIQGRFLWKLEARQEALALRQKCRKKAK